MRSESGRQATIVCTSFKLRRGGVSATSSAVIWFADRELVKVLCSPSSGWGRRKNWPSSLQNIHDVNCIMHDWCQELNVQMKERA